MCEFDGCDKAVKARNLCDGHYKQNNLGKELTALQVKHFHVSVEERIKLYTTVNKTGCWEWTAAKNNKGYGIMGNRPGYSRLAHRASYAAFYGPITEADMIHHKCANNACVNPEHLQKIDVHSNNAEMMERKFYKKQIRELTALVKQLKRQLSKCKCEVKQ